MKLRTCVTPEGRFVYGIHKPAFKVKNLREETFLQSLGLAGKDTRVMNSLNFPEGDVEELQGEWIYEIPNPFPFRGTTYIGRTWADAKAKDPSGIKLEQSGPASMTGFLEGVLDKAGRPGEGLHDLFAELPEPVLLVLASTSTDPEDLVRLAELACDFVYEEGDKKSPGGLHYEKSSGGRLSPRVLHHDLFEALVNNPALPDVYKEVMVLRPGVQGGSEIVGEWPEVKGSHVFEYLRRNSYIPWGHYASNMANDRVRYSIADLSDKDFEGLRHLYYQRTFVRLAEQLGIETGRISRCLEEREIESLRQQVIDEIGKKGSGGLQFDATLWGWNYGFDFAASGYRLHASHQQIHQQFAMVPKEVSMFADESRVLPSYSCGDMVHEFVKSYGKHYSSSFFDDYIRAVRNNSRMDGNTDLEKSLVVHEDESVMLYVPKAQTSQWELQLVTLKAVGNILEADTGVRAALDRGILAAMRVLTGMGARMVTVIEFSGRIGADDVDQRLLYSFLPKIPYSMGAFSEAQLRFVNGHYPEDFAAACRLQMAGQ